MRIRTDDLMASEVEGQLVVLDLRSSAYLRLNRSGTRLWLLLQRGCREDDLVAELVQIYSIDIERASTDVRAFLAMLDRFALVDR